MCHVLAWYASRISKYGQNRELVHNIVEELVGNDRAFHLRLIKSSKWSPFLIKEALNMVTSWTDIDLILAAQFCIADYVREEVALNPSILNQGSNEPSILESAIFGYTYLFPLQKNSIEAPNQRDTTNSQQRVELIAFLLDSGADPKQLGIAGSRIIDRVKEHTFDMAPLNDGQSYWDAVQALLEDTKYSSWRCKVSQLIQPQLTPLKKTLRRRFSRIKKWFRAHD
ncbi:hypothetical protein F4813DRAFT_396501 [Daldinia decipiens]|uniref:uncharacterized protein n=1 Tax=Daldinia decipiens TaxID=326647 RepID=UPI0020C3902E|nr:uncharacterized protein F4813DRAFT_396501 [Daldinia decipiens]KAI1657359.1 hypothetical protein F4813DRAFT_396501 [Daldinia decipiens]